MQSAAVNNWRWREVLNLSIIWYAISLGDVGDCANTERFRVLVRLLLRLCPLSVPELGVCGVYSESPQKGLLGTPGSACCTDDMFEIFVRHENHLVKNGPVSCPKTGPF